MRKNKQKDFTNKTGGLSNGQKNIWKNRWILTMKCSKCKKQIEKGIMFTRVKDNVLCFECSNKDRGGNLWKYL